MQHCTLNLCVSHYVERKVKAIAPKAKTILIYNGTNLRPDKTTSPRKENIVLTVASVQSEQTFHLKGFRPFSGNGTSTTGIQIHYRGYGSQD